MVTGSVLFSETQRFRQWWIVAVLGVIALGSLWAFVQQVVIGEPFGDNPASDGWLIAIVVVFGMGLPAFILSISLRTEVRRDAVLVRLWPIHRNWVRIPVATVHEAAAVTYSPIREYGGWGLRYGPNGKAYNVRGNRGVRIVHGSGERLLIGSQRADDLARAIAAARGEARG